MTDLKSSVPKEARLIPIVKDTNGAEQRMTSIFLASLQMIPAMASYVSNLFIARPVIGVESYVEVDYEIEPNSWIRPDGLIKFYYPDHTPGACGLMSVLVESKVFNNNLRLNQIERYVQCAIVHEVDALLTISNQMDITNYSHPTHGVESLDFKVSHISWKELMMEIFSLLKTGVIDDPEQVVVAKQVISYMDSEHSGVK